MRSVDSLKNSITNTIGQILMTIIHFVVRMIFIRMLGDVYQSINGLFTNILSMLSLAELGLDFAICYSLYKPLAEKDTNKVNQYMSLYKSIYRIIGLVILGLGLILMPFLKLLVGEEYMVKEIYIIFFLFLAKTCVSYWLFSYRSTLIQADQKKYRLQKFNYLFEILSSAVQIVVLLLFKSFIGYLLVAIAFTILRNLFIGYFVGKSYPYINTKPEGKLSKDDKKALFKNVYGSALYKVSSTIYNSSDSIIIAASALSFVSVGYYSNYMLVFTSLTTLVSKIINSSQASIGNFNVTESVARKKELYNTISFVNFWIYGVISVCCVALIDPFVSIFFTSRSVLDFGTVILMIANFMLGGLIDAVILFKDACGLFYKGRFRPILSTIFNIVFSILLVKPLGLAGIILGTIISRVLSTFWYDPFLVYKHVFKKNIADFYIRYTIQFLFVCILGTGFYFLSKLFTITNPWIWIVSGIGFFTLANVIFLTCFWWTKEFKFVKRKIFSFLKRKKAE